MSIGVGWPRRALVVGLDAASPPGQLQGLGIADRKAGLLRRIDRHGAGMTEAQRPIWGGLG
jgi:hypothetical protein